MAKTIEDCLAQVRTTVGAVSGIRAAPPGVPDSSAVYPFFAAWIGPSTVYRESADTVRGLWSIIGQIHFDRKDLYRAEEHAKTFPRPIANALVSDPDLNSTCDTFERVTISRFGPLAWGETPTVGFEFVIEGIKIREASAAT